MHVWKVLVCLELFVIFKRIRKDNLDLFDICIYDWVPLKQHEVAKIRGQGKWPCFRSGEDIMKAYLQTCYL